MGKKLRIGVIAAIAPLLIICTVFITLSSIFYSQDEDDSERELSLIDVAIYIQPKKGDFSETNYDDSETVEWLKPCQSDINNMRKSAAFTPDTSKSEELQYQVADAKDRASAFYLTWYMTYHESPIPAGQNTDWNAYETCFEETSLTSLKDVTEYSINTDDACWKKIEDLYGISIKKSIKKDTELIYEQLHYSSYYKEYVPTAGTVGELFQPEKYKENSVAAGNSQVAEEIWDQVGNDSKGLFNLSPSYLDGDPQCVDFAHWRFTTIYKQDWANAGNGKDCAYNIVATYPDENHTTKEGYYFTLSNQPSGGAVFSMVSGEWGHVGFVEKVEDGYVWFSDGNVKINGVSNGIRINNKMTVDTFLKNPYTCNNSCVFANPSKKNK